MNVALFIVTHEGIANNLLRTALSIINDQPENINCFEIPMDAPVETIKHNIQNRIEQLDKNKEILFLTDIYGGTPSNIASSFINDEKIRLISGLNLAMIIKAINYRDLPLNELVEKIIEGGRQSIMQRDNENPICK
ncbi:MAG: PTS sugar transporter subunit IIA [Gammaproteobacteria bacterium]|nr:PTS sugar transporter subunit IIA [Gammaproteobacteria bacterium]